MYGKIKKLCESKGISIHQMCSDLSINDSIISNLKNRDSQSGLSAENVVKIAEYFEIPAGELLKKE